MLIATAAIAGTPSGFYEAKVLEPAASFVAGKPVVVYCAQTEAGWRAFLDATGRAGIDATGSGVVGSAVVGSSELQLAPEVCAWLRLALRQQLPATVGVAASIQAFTHEAIHDRGERDEGVTDCAAMHEMPRVAARFFRFPAGKRLRSLMAVAWRWHARVPAVYRSVC